MEDAIRLDSKGSSTRFHRRLKGWIVAGALVTLLFAAQAPMRSAEAVLVIYNDAQEAQNHYETSCCFSDLAGGQTQLSAGILTAEIYSRRSSGANYASASSPGAVSMTHAKPAGAILKSWCRWTYPASVSGTSRTQCWQRV